MRIAIVNDVSMVVAALTHVILEYTEHTIAWTAADGVQAVEQCAADRPDAILMDLIMPHMDGIEASKRIMDATPCAILVVTASVTGNSAKVFEAMAAGALDAISTPTLGGARTRDGIQSLKKKLDSISHLISRHTPAPQPAPALPTQRGQFSTSLIAIGSSTGGPGSLAQILSALPADFSAGIVIIQHVDSHFAPGLAQWLNDQSPLNVRLAEDGDRPQAGTVLIAGTSDHLILRKNGRLHYTAEPAAHIYRPSVDVFFDSVATCWQDDAIGVLLTGMGRDGASGLLALKRRGMYTIAQDKNSCAVYGMPKAAVELNAAAAVLPVGDIAHALTRELTRNGKEHPARGQQHHDQ